MIIDTADEWGRSVARLLETETVAWLTTIRASGEPWPNPVWFVWDGETVLLYSTPDAAKLRHIRRDPRVTLHLNGEGWEKDIVVLGGEGRESDDPPAHEHDGYVAKYGELILRLGMGWEEYGATYSVPLRLTPSSARGH